MRNGRQWDTRLRSGLRTGAWSGFPRAWHRPFAWQLARGRRAENALEGLARRAGTGFRQPVVHRDLECYILAVHSSDRDAPMSTGSVFVNNRAQAVRLPADSCFPDDVKQVNVRIVGKDRVLSPVDNTWDSFFLSEEHVSDDFMEERAAQEQSEREAF